MTLRGFGVHNVLDGAGAGLPVQICIWHMFTCAKDPHKVLGVPS